MSGGVERAAHHRRAQPQPNLQDAVFSAELFASETADIDRVKTKGQEYLSIARELVP